MNMTLKNANRLFPIFLMLLMAFSFCGCQSSETDQHQAEKSVSDETGKSNQNTVQSEKEQNSAENQKADPTDDAEALSALHVSGTQLQDELNQPVILQGFSTFGINYMPETVNKNMFQFLKDEMDSDIIRLALYPETDNQTGYCNGGNQEELRDLIKNGVKYASETGQYSIIDWHVLTDGNPNDHLEEARDFFEMMSSEFADNSGVLYEICNEPNGDVNWQGVKAYAEAIVPVIRKNAPEAIILIGTPNWDQDEVEVSANPIENESNIMYTVHFYAATHKQEQRDQLKEAHKRGLPMFVSEFGISEASGNGTLDEQSGDAWIELLNEYKISRVAWAISNKNESSAIFKPDTDLNNPFLSNLSDYGKWLYQTYTGKALDSESSESAENKEQPASMDKPQVTTDPALQPDLKEVNSWTSDGSDFIQYSLSLTNDGKNDLSDWKVTLNYDQTVSVNDSWNGNIKVNDSVLTITPASWNKEIKAGSSITDIGFIVKTS